MTREERREILSAEAIRAAVLETDPPKDPASSEDAILLDALWTLFTPSLSFDRVSEYIGYFTPEEGPEPEPLPMPPRRKLFTAHSHPGEPLTPSPDDLAVYYRLERARGACVNYILDGPDGVRVD